MSSRDIQMETSADILSIASRYIVVSVLIIAIGAVSTVYAILDYIVYGFLHGIFLVFGGFFLGIAFVIIGLFIGVWGLFWMRTEGKRLRKRFEISNSSAGGSRP
ncbi:MAG: hypothetical protein AM325_012090 [Candidatus Thorarchaeota archaeon SMTZ1-45]|nr:MAG: hypothetical protein AM325_13775 [Candidatus Thorarchaeota archaeon SMTZ1-45]